MKVTGILSEKKDLLAHVTGGQCKGGLKAWMNPEAAIGSRLFPPLSPGSVSDCPLTSFLASLCVLGRKATDYSSRTYCRLISQKEERPPLSVVHTPNNMETPGMTLFPKFHVPPCTSAEIRVCPRAWAHLLRGV